MSSTKSIIPDTASFETKMIHHEEKRQVFFIQNSQMNWPPELQHVKKNHDFNSKETTTQPDRLYVVEAMIKYIRANEGNKHWNLVKIRELKLEKYHHIKMFFQGEKVINNKAILFSHGVMQQWGIKYLEN